MNSKKYFRLWISISTLIVLMLVVCKGDYDDDYDYYQSSTTEENDMENMIDVYSTSDEKVTNNKIESSINSLHNDLKKQREKQYGIFYYKKSLKKKIDTMKRELSEYDEKVNELEKFYNHLSKFSLFELAFCMKTYDFQRANEITTSEPISLTEWHFILNEVSDGLSSNLNVIKDADRYLEFNNNKIRFFVSLAESGRRKTHTLDHLVRSFETNLTLQAKNLFKKALKDGEFFVNPAINNIEWADFTNIWLNEEHYHNSTEKHFLFSALNRAISELYKDIVIADIIDRLVNESVEAVTSNQFVKDLYLFGSLFIAIRDHDDLENSNLFLLAAKFKEFSNSYTTKHKANNKFISWINEFETYLPGCVFRIVFSPSSSTFIIENGYYKEYLYGMNNIRPDGYYWNWVPRDDYPIMTNVKNTNTISAEKWTLEANYNQNKFWIRKSNQTDRYLYLSHETYPLNPNSSQKTISNSIQIIPDKNSNGCYLKNAETNKYLNAVAEIEKGFRILYMKFLDDNAKQPFLWNIEPAVK